MIVKIFPARASFGAVRYNTDKIERSDGELMRIGNFGMIENGFDLKPQDVKNYLAAFSLANPNITKPQFHATISCKGRELGKDELSDLAEKWLVKMGYGDNPYLVVFHSDTPNNHVHLVSSRVGLDGKKINDGFEKRRAQQYLKELIGKKRGAEQANQLRELESYRFTTLAQFRLLLERSGYQARIRETQLEVYRGVDFLHSYALEELRARMGQGGGDAERLLKLRAILHKYRQLTDLKLTPEYRILSGGRPAEITGYHSALSRLMHQKFGLEFVFHFKDTKAPYGYTVIDHQEKQIYKGSELMKLAQLCAYSPQATLVFPQQYQASRRAAEWRVSSGQAARLLADYLDVPIENLSSQFFPLNAQEQAGYRQRLVYLIGKRGAGVLQEQGISILKDGNSYFLLDSRSRLICELDGLLTLAEVKDLTFEQTSDLTETLFRGIGICADQDDESVYGRRRRGKTARRANH